MLLRLILSVALVATQVLEVQAGTPVPAVDLKTVLTTGASNPDFGGPKDHSTPEQIEADYKAFTDIYRDYAELYSASEYRTTGAQKLFEKIKMDLPSVQLKVAAIKKRLDKLQKSMRSLMLLNAVRVSEKQLPRIYKLAKLAASRLELRGNFNIFVLGAPDFNAFTYSYNLNDFDVVLHSAAVETLSDDALLALIGHEMGHVKDQSILMKSMLAAGLEKINKVSPGSMPAQLYSTLFDDLPSEIPNFPNMQRVMARLVESLSEEAEGMEYFANYTEATEFARNCEISADRAALLASGEPATLKLLGTMAHGSKVLSPEFSIDALIQQITDVLSSNEEPGEIEDLVGGQSTHPFNVLRMIHARDFAKSKVYADINARLSQDAFGKEMDLLVRNLLRLKNTAEKFKKYNDGKAETDDLLIRLKIVRQFEGDIKGVTAALQVLGRLFLLQLEGSDLTRIKNALFEQYVEKVKNDKSDVLRQATVPTVLELLKRLEKDAKDEALKAIQERIKIVETLAALG